MNDNIATISLSKSELKTFTLTKEILTGKVENLLTDTYVIAVVNMSSKCFTIMGTRRIGGSDAEWKWTPIPQTCKNCSTSYQQCVKENKFSAVMTTSCNSSPFEAFIGYVINETDVQGAIFDIYPNCSYAGGVVGITD
jgi:hypothetical protein